MHIGLTLKGFTRPSLLTERGGKKNPTIYIIFKIMMHLNTIINKCKNKIKAVLSPGLMEGFSGDFVTLLNGFPPAMTKKKNVQIVVHNQSKFFFLSQH